MNNKPAPYSNTDFQENESVYLFVSKIDRKHIKTDIKTREKTPNVDGYIEIVDEDNIPICKFEIQVRTIKTKHKSYYCPLENVNYTNVTTLPILLILVDIVEKCVFWKHLISTNARQSPVEKSYIFDLSEEDKIDENNNYLTKWRIIAENYIDKIKSFSNDISTIGQIIRLPKNISIDGIKYFQKYIDKVNYLLDNDYSIVKQIFFSDYWKLGVSVYKFDPDLSFGIFGIPHGNIAPLVNEITNKEDFQIFSKNYLHKFYFSRTDNNPDIIANDFVLEFVKIIFSQKILLPIGHKMAEEYVYYVISKCYYMFGLEKNKSYIVDEIATGLDKYLILWLSIALDNIDYPKNPRYPKEENIIDIIYLANVFYFFPDHYPNKLYKINQTFKSVIAGQENHEIKRNIKLNSSKFDIYIFLNCLNYLKNNNINKVEASLPEPDYNLIVGKKLFYMVDLYNQEARKEYGIKFYQNIKSIINDFVNYYKLPEEYKIFSDKKCHYFIIPEIINRTIGNFSTDMAGVTIIVTYRHEDDVNNVTIIEDEKLVENLNSSKFWDNGFQYNGKTYNVISLSDSIDNDIFEELPFYNRVYSYLQETVGEIIKVKTTIKLKDK
jgi:hypothetical protein